MKGGRVPIHIMRWAPADYVNDPFVRLLVAEEDFATLAFYHLVLNWSHMEGGDLPADPRQLAATLGMKRHRVARSLEVCLGASKLVVRNGRLCHPRVLREVENELAYRAEQAGLGRVGGRKAGRGRAAKTIGVPLIEDRGTPIENNRSPLSESIGPPCAVRRAPAPAPENERTERPPGSPQAVENGPGEGGGGDPEREQLLEVCGSIAEALGSPPAAIVERVAAIPAGNGRPSRSFTDPHAKGVSIEWVRAALGRARDLRREVGKPVPL